VKRFLAGVMATFTIKNTNSGNHLTFKVSKPKDKATGKVDHKATVRFVSLLSGPDNTRSYTYVGSLFTNQAGDRFTLTKGSKVGRDSASFRAFDAMWRILNAESRLPNGLEFWHASKCCRCARPLTHPRSIQNGIGPECEGKTEGF
jgi:Family of unknown function (DUF6011)